MAALPYSGVSGGDADNCPAVAITHGASLDVFTLAGVNATVSLFLPSVIATGGPNASFATIVSESPSAGVIPK